MKRDGNGGLSQDAMSAGLRNKIQEQRTARQEEVWNKIQERLRKADVVTRLELMQEGLLVGLFQEHAFHILRFAIEQVAEDRYGHLYDNEFAERFRVLEEKYGIDTTAEDYDRASNPEQYQALEAEYEEAWEKLWLTVAREFGEYEIARLRENDRGEFDRRDDETEAAWRRQGRSLEEIAGDSGMEIN